MPFAELLDLPRQRHPLRDMFIRWQCRVRQIAMRQNGGRPDDAVMPELTLPGASEPLGHVITVLSKGPAASKTPELQHMVRYTNDPAQRRDKALQFLSETYYQKPREFSDILTATFPPGSAGAKAIVAAGRCSLAFSAYNQRFDLRCTVLELTTGDALYEATWWHNLLFNPNLHPDTIVLGFKPDWEESMAQPGPTQEHR